MNNYDIYYKKYIGYISNKFIVPNKNIVTPINKDYTYLVIITKINNEEIISINKTYYKDFIKFYNSKKDKFSILDILKLFFKEKNINIKIRNMYRMTKYKKDIRDTKNIIFKDNYKKCVILDNDNIVSYAKISDINNTGANIVIFTEKMYRNKGYATNLLSFITNYCIENKLLPIFLVDKKNKASIKVAKNIDYKIMNEEIIILLEKLK